MIRLIAIIACMLISEHAQAAVPLPGPVPAEILDVIDGDTLAVRALIWPGHSVETRVRLRGVDTPETYRPGCEREREAGRAASAFTQAWIEAALAPDAGADLNPPEVSLHEIDLGSFAGRVVASVRRADGADLADDLIAAGLGVTFGDEGSWCETDPMDIDPEP